MFVLVPLVVLTMVYLAGGKTTHTVLESPEWAFGASILFGQSIIKLVSGAIRLGTEKWETIVLIVAIVMVLGLVPSLIVLALILTNEPPNETLLIAQLILFVIGSIAFFILGALGHYGLFHDPD